MPPNVFRTQYIHTSTGVQWLGLVLTLDAFFFKTPNMEPIVYLLRSHPLLGYVGSAGFGGLSGLSMLNEVTIFVGLIGVAFGALGAFFTFLIQLHNWKNRINKSDTNDG